jgi:hypothetical protein
MCFLVSMILIIPSVVFRIASMARWRREEKLINEIEMRNGDIERVVSRISRSEEGGYLETLSTYSTLVRL